MSKHIHILGICGTFMGGLALIARQLGYQVSGSDANVYPPMSTQLEASGITLHEGYDESILELKPDLVVVGNAMSRGLPIIEALLNSNIPYTSGPQWLGDNVLRNRWVLAVSGTHGKTTTSSLLAWMLEEAGLQPGFLIGGVTANFGVSARLGQDPFFVIEADEYDTAFFDKRSKFLHYHPRTLILNNLEFDHADIFDSLQDIQKQFHHLLRVVPSLGQVIYPRGVSAIDEVLAKGLWAQSATFGSSPLAQWNFRWRDQPAGEFLIKHGDNEWLGTTALSGDYNLSNVLAAIIAARHVGVSPEHSIAAISTFRNTKRRQELIADVGGIKVIDDFAHHPTAIQLTLQGLKATHQSARVVLVIEPRSNTMRMGVHANVLADATSIADQCYWLRAKNMGFELTSDLVGGQVFDDVDNLVAALVPELAPSDVVVCMSNGDFQGLKDKLVQALKDSYE
ncbi:MAG: UDP-N-acetylmuramate:L-alanyl-gamma-D-glutamyl-meso-diaminopimelate ligase [Halieaceae bacterium]|nr:UDP-N-acetylmuramate:L-alanyl-gamma-D-glutamyl-meso-diaminopimelate ligase [Halieaceae bacterium]